MASRYNIALAGWLLAGLFLPALLWAGDAKEPRARVAETLDALHAYAAEADFERYFALYSPAAVFLGTDASERWSVEEFKNYARPVFASGRGWTYTVVQRWITVSMDGNTAWFDEVLDNASLGSCRGSGVLVRSGDDWLITQYNLTIPIPNDLADEFAARIEEFEASGQGAGSD
jgi:hypothetical protein